MIDRINAARLRFCAWLDRVYERLAERIVTARFVAHRNRMMHLYSDCTTGEIPWSVYGTEKQKFVRTWARWYQQTVAVSPYLHDHKRGL